MEEEKKMRGRDGGKFPRTEGGRKREGRKQFIQSFKALYGAGSGSEKLLIAG
jgi:hypothetical protein